MIKLPDDEALNHLMLQLGAVAAALARRLYELTGLQATDEGVIREILRAVARASTSKSMPRGPVVSLAEARAAKTPYGANYAGVVIEDLPALDAIVRRLHGEANTTTRSLVLRRACDLGLQKLSEERTP